MSSISKQQDQLVVPVSVQRRAGIKSGDRLQFKASRRTITITITAVDEPGYKPTKAELAAIRKGEAQIASGRFVALPELLHELDSHRRRSGAKTTRKVPAKDQSKIAAALLAMANNSFSGDIVMLEGEQNRWRRRVGHHRIFFSVNKTARMVAISAILRRTSTTY
jgi:mRNA-degrading endonuclease RelE of RelBE toxin-antitoxin system